MKTQEKDNAYNRCMVAYISRVVYPEIGANSIQTIQMASAFARQTGNGHLFVPRITYSIDQILQQYGIENTPLHIRSLQTQQWPSLIRNSSKFSSFFYNSAIAWTLRFSPAWRKSPNNKMLFVRSTAESLYWGLMRPYLRWLDNWIVVCEVHDLKFAMQHEEFSRCDMNKPAANKTARALAHYDVVLTVSHGLASDIRTLTNGIVKPHVVPNATGLPRLSKPPVLRFPRERIVLGYIGTLDPQHGIEDLIAAIKLLPKNFLLRIVGRVRPDYGDWFNALMTDRSLSEKIELKPFVPYSEIMSEIDEYDFALAPAGKTVDSIKYRSPLKILDYMARGKPIIAAGVPCHLELLQHGVNAFIYPKHDPHTLAAHILTLAKNPLLAESLAKAAWKQSADHTYDVRAQHILKLAEEARGR